MSLETYWLVVPLVGIGLCAAGAVAMWITHPRRKAARRRGSERKQIPLPLT
jgi:uncharacterized protein involved in cysteine biosynthesis